MTKKREGFDTQLLRLGTMVGPPFGFFSSEVHCNRCLSFSCRAIVIAWVPLTFGLFLEVGFCLLGAFSYRIQSVLFHIR